ncbi:cell wall binding repeat-containing protein [Clostridium sp. DL-VIII]|uniref:sunset domain-containing protein n=1 Tax=Clostridium sp. DL-VIII TaxID=641107 RepID=UPI00023AF23A|nr:cell wall-binding repeat-containing protein [Clostridium sp. DL-VIII]EHI97670.1 cell wall binding repeat-containing protein [Clostridium sp. DL-VIII]
MINFLFLVSLICLIIGIIKPNKLMFWLEESKRNRKNVLKYFGTATIIFLILVGVFNSSNSTKVTNSTISKNEVVENTGGEQKQEKIEKPQDVKKVGWTQENGKWYYYGEDGKTKTGWIKDDNKSYYLSSSGILQTGWVKDNGKDYYLDDLGVMQTGWKESNDKWYYLSSDGSMEKNTTVDGYHLSASGVMEEKNSSNSSGSSNSVTSSSSGGTQYVDENGNGLIKGSVNHIYHVPGSTYYSRTKNVARWFKTVEEAQAAGYRAPEK